MKGTDFSKGTWWAIMPAVFDGLARGWTEFSRGALDHEAMIFRMNAGKTDQTPYEMVDGVAVVNMQGPLSKRSSLYSMFMGGGSMQAIAQAVRAAAADPAVEAIVLDIDSPGGTVSGTEALANVIRQAREQKPVVSFANGRMCSAAYWAGSGASAIVAESTADVGSIGVLIVHYDYSEQDRKFGVKITYVASGKYKTIGNNAEPLSGFARDVLQAETDYVYGLFVRAVALNRNVPEQQVLESMADGRVFIGAQAVEAGLADHVGTREDAINLARSLAGGGQSTFTTGAGASVKRMEETTMGAKEESPVIETMGQLEKTYPGLVEQIRQDAAQGADHQGARMEAATEERERIMGLVNIQFGESAGAGFAKVVESGVTVEQFQAIRGVQAPQGQDADKEAMLRAIQEAGAGDPGSGNPPGTGVKDFMALVDEHQKTKGCNRAQALKAVANSHPKAHGAWLDKQRGDC